MPPSIGQMLNIRSCPGFVQRGDCDCVHKWIERSLIGVVADNVNLIKDTPMITPFPKTIQHIDRLQLTVGHWRFMAKFISWIPQK